VGFRSLFLTVPLLLAAQTAWSATIHVDWGGGGDYTTITEAVAAATSGDTVLIACGTYCEHDIEIGTNLVLRSETGHADCVTIDGQGLGKVCRLSIEELPSVIEGITFANGYQDSPWFPGGGLAIYDAPVTVRRCAFHNNTGPEGGGASAYGGPDDEGTVTFEECEFIGNHSGCGGGGLETDGTASLILNCVFIGNSASASGGGLQVSGGSAVKVSGCIFLDNEAGYRGGAIRCRGAVVLIAVSTLVGNRAPTAACLMSAHEAHVSVERSVLAFGLSGGAVACVYEGTVDVWCSDIYGNAGGDWVDCITGQGGINANMSEDPLFCGERDATAPFMLHSDSPCAADNSPCGLLVGALGVGCGSTPVDYRSWGGIKALYRAGLGGDR